MNLHVVRDAAANWIEREEKQSDEIRLIKTRRKKVQLFSFD